MRNEDETIDPAAAAKADQAEWLYGAIQDQSPEEAIGILTRELALLYGAQYAQPIHDAADIIARRIIRTGLPIVQAACREGDPETLAQEIKKMLARYVKAPRMIIHM